MKAGRGGIESGEAPLWCFHETSADLEDPVTGSQCSGQDHHALEEVGAIENLRSDTNERNVRKRREDYTS